MLNLLGVSCLIIGGIGMALGGIGLAQEDSVSDLLVGAILLTIGGTACALGTHLLLT